MFNSDYLQIWTKGSRTVKFIIAHKEICGIWFQPDIWYTTSTLASLFPCTCSHAYRVPWYWWAEEVVNFWPHSILLPIYHQCLKRIKFSANVYLYWSHHLPYLSRQFFSNPSMFLAASNLPWKRCIKAAVAVPMTGNGYLGRSLPQGALIFVIAQDSSNHDKK